MHIAELLPLFAKKKIDHVTNRGQKFQGACNALCKMNGESFAENLPGRNRSIKKASHFTARCPLILTIYLFINYVNLYNQYARDKVMNIFSQPQ